MKNIIHNFIYFVVPSVVCFICFGILSISSFGASTTLTLGSGASQSLSSGLSSVFDLSSMSASPDPLGFSIGLSKIYDNLDQYLYQNYNYDLTGTMNDTLEGKNALLNGNQNISSVTADSFVNKITNGLYSGVAELTGAGYALYKGVTNGLGQAKNTFFIGKAQDGVISETLGGALTYVDDNTLSMYESSLSNAISNNSLVDLTVNDKFVYGKNYHFVQNSNINFTLNFEDNIFLCSKAVDDFQVIAVTTYDFNDTIPGNGVLVSFGTPFPFVGYKILSIPGVSDFVVNGVTYHIGYLAGVKQSGTSYVYSDKYLGSYSGISDALVANGSGYLSGVYSLSPDIEAILQQLLGELKGHYVSTSDLDVLIDSLSNNGVISNDDVVIDGVTENVPVIDWSQDYIDTLQGIIEGILENSAVYDDVISDSNAVTPDPGPDTYDNTGTAVPDGLPGIFSPIIETIQVPFSVVSMFEPIFYIFSGGLSSLFSIWLLFPLFILVLLVIWALK